MSLHSVHFPVSSLDECALPEFFGRAFIAVEAAVNSAMQLGAESRESGNASITEFLESTSTLSDCWMRLIEKTLECAFDEAVEAPGGQPMEGYVSLTDALAIIHKYSYSCNSLLKTAVGHAYEFGANFSEDGYHSMAQAREAVIAVLSDFRRLVYRSQF